MNPEAHIHIQNRARLPMVNDILRVRGTLSFHKIGAQGHDILPQTGWVFERTRSEPVSSWPATSMGCSYAILQYDARGGGRRLYHLHEAKRVSAD